MIFNNVRKIWETKDYVQLLIGSLTGLSRLQISQELERTPGKIFSKLQKHMKMIEDIHKALLEFSGKQGETG